MCRCTNCTYIHFHDLFQNISSLPVHTFISSLPLLHPSHEISWFKSMSGLHNDVFKGTVCLVHHHCYLVACYRMTFFDKHTNPIYICLTRYHFWPTTPPHVCESSIDSLPFINNAYQLNTLWRLKGTFTLCRAAQSGKAARQKLRHATVYVDVASAWLRHAVRCCAA